MKRSGFFQKIAVGTFGAIFMQKQAFAAFNPPGSMSGIFYIGSYVDTPDGGITICRFFPGSGEIHMVDVCKGIANPSFMISGSRRQYLYIVNETGDFGGKSSGSVSAFRRDAKTGKLAFLNVQASLGAHPCHLTIDRTGRFILVANYSGGNVAVLPVGPDGKLAGAVEMVQHSGHGPNAGRQESAHAHSVNLSPDNRFAFVCDLGIDKIMIYRFDEKTGKLSPSSHPFFQTAPGAGPRHFTFAADGKQAFVVNELNSTLTSLKFDPDTGILSELETLSTLPDGFSAENTCADVHVHPNNRFVYASNRGHDSIAVFSIDKVTGKLEFIQHQSVSGKTPRNFSIHPSGRFLLAANQNSNSINTFSLDPETGKLNQTGKSIQIDKPVCILF